MWHELYVPCRCELNKIRKLGIFVYEGEVYAVNICDFGNGLSQCDCCVADYYTFLKEHPDSLKEINNSDNPLRLKST